MFSQIIYRPSTTLSQKLHVNSILLRLVETVAPEKPVYIFFQILDEWHSICRLYCGYLFPTICNQFHMYMVD